MTSPIPGRAATPAARRMSKYLARVATGPRMSKDLSADEARDAVDLALRGELDRAQVAAFLIALRMKLETHDELRGALTALRAHARWAETDVDDLVDLADPYNGYVRHVPAVAFLPAVLAACGLPAALHGRRAQGPKWGLTPHRILLACGADPGGLEDLEPAGAAARVADPDVGWAYLDVPRYCPALAELDEVRALIVKRPCLSLLEKLIAPLRARRRTHLVVGYTHRNYDEILDAVARAGVYASMLAPRGVEGGVIPSCASTRRGVRAPADGDAMGPLEGVTFDPAAMGVVSAARADPLPGHTDDVPSEEELAAWAEAAARAGWAALGGEEGGVRRGLVAAAGSILAHVGRASGPADGAARAAEALASGAARDHFARGLERAPAGEGRPHERGRAP